MAYQSSYTGTQVEKILNYIRDGGSISVSINPSSWTGNSAPYSLQQSGEYKSAWIIDGNGNRWDCDIKIVTGNTIVYSNYKITGNIIFSNGSVS